MTGVIGHRVEALILYHRQLAWEALTAADYDFLTDNGWGGYTEKGKLMPRPGPLSIKKFVRLQPDEVEQYQEIADRVADGELSVLLRQWIREGAFNHSRRLRRARKSA